MLLSTVFAGAHAQTAQDVAGHMNGKWTLDYGEKERELYVTSINGNKISGFYPVGSEKKQVEGEVVDQGDHFVATLTDMKAWDWSGVFSFHIDKASWDVKGFWSAQSKDVKKEFTATNPEFSTWAKNQGSSSTEDISSQPTDPNVNPDQTLIVAEGQEGTMAFNKGIDHMKAGEFELAMGEFDAAIQADKGFAEAYFQRGIVKNKIQRYEDAIIDFDLSVKNGYDEAYVYYNMGVSYFMLGKYEDAIKQYNTAIVKKPDYAYAFNDRGSSKRMLEDFEGAIEDYSKAIELDPKTAIYYNNLGSVYRKLEEYEDAKLNYSLAIRLDKDYVIAYNNRGSAKSDDGDYEEAIEDYQKAIELDPKYVYAYNNIGSVLIKEEKFEEAIEALDKAIEVDDQYGYAYLNRGIAKENIRDDQGACADWEKARELGVKKAVSYLFQCDDFE